jgi:hypothetical protein
MSKIFCSSVLDTATKTAAIVAGSEFAVKNPSMMAVVLPAAQGIMASVDSGTSQQAVNAVFALGVQELLAHMAGGDPIVLAAVQGVLATIKFDPTAKTPALLDNAIIKDVVDGFVQGLTAVPAK